MQKKCQRHRETVSVVSKSKKKQSILFFIFLPHGQNPLEDDGLSVGAVWGPPCFLCQTASRKR